MLKVEKGWFVDENGRKVLLRGVNLGGSTKVPVSPNGATHIKTDFRDHKNVSFVGHPFPLKEADEHFKRLKHWGFNCLRFLVTWEAIEHKGPKLYDKEYLDYIEEVLKIAGEYEFYTFIDPHQDEWSRMTGGDGAPGWTFEKVGLDFTNFDAADAVLVMQYRYDKNNVEAYPPMCWGQNTNRFANKTMWTLFFGGKDLAPSFKIDGINAQDYLQEHYIDAIQQIALRVKDNPYVIGFDTLNEPNEGWIEEMVDGTKVEGGFPGLAHVFTPIDAMLTGSGYTRKVGYYEIKGQEIVETRKDEMNKANVSCWLNERLDIWKNEGIWELDDYNEPVIRKNDHFAVKQGKKVSFTRDYLSPFIKRYSETIRNIIPNTIIFIEGPVAKVLLGNKLEFNLPRNLEPMVNASHWYDIITLATKNAMINLNFDLITRKPFTGEENIQNLFIQQLKHVKSISEVLPGVPPSLIGEFGLPYDLNNKIGFKKFKKNPEKAWKIHTTALNMYYNALDANLLHSAQWNYTADNNNEWGDLWNLEDLSIFSRDQQTNPDDINSGGRAIEGFCRPYFVYCAGTPLKMEFNLKKGNFIFEFDGDSSIRAPTILYVPKIQFPNGYEVSVSEGEIEEKHDKQLVFIKISESGIHSVKISRSN